MNFILIAKDHPDPKALERRINSRQAHLKNILSLEKKNIVVYAVGLVESDKIIGSVIVFNVTKRDEIDKYMKTEPYIVDNVWNEISITQCLIPKIFT